MLDTSGCEKPAGRRPGGFAGLRVSKFRHVYGVPAKKEKCYEGARITRRCYFALLITLLITE